MSESTFTVPAMRAAAEKLRTDATALVAEAEIQMQQYLKDVRSKAEEMRAAADEIDADADAKTARRDAAEQTQAPEQPCTACGQPMVTGPLGWQHKDPYAPCHLGQVVQPTGDQVPAAPAQDGADRG